MCVTVQVYAPESYRSRQMMDLHYLTHYYYGDLNAIYIWSGRVDDVRSVVSGQSSHGSAPGGPCVSGSSVKRLAEQTPKIPEWANALSGMNLPAQPTETHDSEKGVSFRRRRPRGSMGLKRSASSILNKRNNQEGFAATTATSSNPTPSGWRKSSVEPREAILQIASEFLTVANIRLTELGERHRFSDLLDGKAYMRLSELAQSIIKQFPYNPNLLKSQALQRFLTEVLPIVEWGHESLRSCKALETLVGRLSRTLPKMLDTPSIRKQVKWDCVTNIIKSLYMTAQRNRSVAQLKEIKVRL
ncbi:unnamed protein product [Dibothriocephalus latus]|uniref:Protein UNC80 C-terminal domain-containing protein n=1 Tax=Dibothriocephalus latus TaxID=60516 RepID=A0A3P6UBZ3_DIBLA|nr:unnamed protein product [Dibothriocephalus latus]